MSTIYLSNDEVRMRMPTDAQLRSEFDRRGMTGSGPAMLGEFTDAALRAEWTRRHPDIPCGDWTDETLRAECERRFGNEYGARDERWDGLVKKAQAETERVAKRAAIASAAVIEREKERDEWKRRAEVAEAAQLEAETTRDAMFRVGARAVRNCRENAERGIATLRPDNSVAFLDEDLLCDDA